MSPCPAMPASSEASLLHIKETLQRSLSRRPAAAAGTDTASSLDQRLASSSKKVLMQKIQFRPAEKASHSYQLESLRAKYTPLNATHSSNGASPEVVDGHKSPENVKMSGESLPSPKVVLFPPDKVRLEWPSIRRIGSGLVNLGNTCFLNATLQCLTYCAPLVNHLMIEDHCGKCKQAGFCMLCELHRHVRRCYEQAGGSIKPHPIVHKLRVIAKHMHLGRQEDAHEFLRYVVDHMQKACLYGHPKLDNFSKDTTAVNQIFGGYLRSQVLCLRCKARSNTYDPFLDISLDIKNVPTVQKALERYVQPERLDSDNAYNCTKCKQKVPAQKRFTIHKAPNVLTVQLKRFDCSRPSAKVTRHVQFPEKLDLRPYMSTKGENPQVYQLYAVLVHSGYSCNSGHYYCYVRAPNRMWYCMNDQHASETSVSRVLSAEAYLLFYQRTKPSHQAPPIRNSIIGPQLPSDGLPKSNPPVVPKKHTPLGSVSNDTGTSVSRKPTPKPGPSFHGTAKPPVVPSTSAHPSIHPAPSSIPNASLRNKISFGIKPKDPQKESDQDKDSKPRLVMHIKHGKVCYNSVEDKKDVKAGSESTKSEPHKLVPYNGESDSSEDGVSLPSKLSNGKPETSLGSATNKTGSPSKTPKSNFEPVIDERLNATQTVPGGYGPLDKLNGRNVGSGRKERPTSFSKDDTHGLFNPTHRNKFLRRSFSDDGLIVDTSPTKLNATTRWNIMDGDAQVSPSLASGSSTASINSTTGWQVRQQDKQKQHGSAKTEKPFPGWKVTPTTAGENAQSTKQEAQPVEPEPKSGHSSGDVSNVGKLHITLKKQTSCSTLPDERDSSQNHSSTDKDTSSKHKTAKNSTSDSELAKPKPKKPCAFPLKLSCLGSVTDSPGERQPLMKHAVAYDMSVYDFNDGDEDSNAKVPFQRTKSSPSELQSEAKELPEIVENGLDEGSLSDEGHSHKKNKKHKKKKKHKKNRDAPPTDEAEEGEIIANQHKKKKKKKHKKRKYEEPEDEPVEEPAKKKKDIPKSGEEYTWVEKSVNTKPENASQKSVPVHQWDQHVNDGYKLHTADGTTNTKQPANQTWDGTRQGGGDVVSELKKASSWGYGGKVMSWEGGTTQVDILADREKRKDHKRHWADDYEEELDRGKTKKVKYPNSENIHNGNHGNMFQRYQDDRNQENGRRKSGFMSPKDHEHAPLPNNRPYHKSGYHSYHDRNHPASHYGNHHKDGYYRENYYKGSYYGHHDRH